ncbi:hypothetical protein Trydic_g3004 [Trypoxylus dichotomus]
MLSSMHEQSTTGITIKFYYSHCLISVGYVTDMKSFQKRINESYKKYLPKLLQAKRIARTVLLSCMLAATLLIFLFTTIHRFSNACRNVDAPQSLKINNFANSIRISWKAPSNQGNCYIYYQIIYTINGGDNVTIITDDLYLDVHGVPAYSTIHVNVWSVSGHSENLSKDYVSEEYKGKKYCPINLIFTFCVRS